MSAHSLSAVLLFVAIALRALLIVETAGAQDTTSGATPQSGVVLVKLSPPVYPPLARQARINGDVVVKVSVRRDGSIESVELFKGHPMLAPSALESARHSTFGCLGCEAATSYLLTYTFGVSAECPHFGPNCEYEEPRAPEVVQLSGHITLTVEPSCTCDPAATIVRVRVRAAKCLYLWACGWRQVEDK
jgi:TonB family protein